MLPEVLDPALSGATAALELPSRESPSPSFLSLLRVPWTARRSNQSSLMEINPEYSLEGLMLKLKLQHFGHQMQRADSLEKTFMMEILRAGRKEGDRR